MNTKQLVAEYLNGHVDVATVVSMSQTIHAEEEAFFQANGRYRHMEDDPRFLYSGL